MVRISDLKTGSQVAHEQMRARPEVRRELDRTAAANALAIRVIRYRAENDLSQRQVAYQVGMQQSAIARIEAGDHEPTLSTLSRLASGLGMQFCITVTMDGQIELR